ncbi:MAG: hypothetical protein IT566_10845, partial [Rhodospirillaceae bacterium]|nr:hypothetical protein [Rhodospirillaceae bacterium]
MTKGYQYAPPPASQSSTFSVTVSDSPRLHYQTDEISGEYLVDPIEVELSGETSGHRLALSGTIKRIGFCNLVVHAETWLPADFTIGTRLKIRALFHEVNLTVRHVSATNQILLTSTWYTRKIAEFFYALMVAGNAAITFRQARKLLGFKPRLEPYLHFKRIDSKDGHQAVLLLRGRTYHRVGKQHSPEPIEDPNDYGGLVYAGYIGDRIISSFR